MCFNYHFIDFFFSNIASGLKYLIFLKTWAKFAHLFQQLCSKISIFGEKKVSKDLKFEEKLTYLYFQSQKKENFGQRFPLHLKYLRKFLCIFHGLVVNELHM